MGKYTHILTFTDAYSAHANEHVSQMHDNHKKQIVVCIGENNHVKNQYQI